MAESNRKSMCKIFIPFNGHDLLVEYTDYDGCPGDRVTAPTPSKCSVDRVYFEDRDITRIVEILDRTQELEELVNARIA